MKRRIAVKARNPDQILDALKRQEAADARGRLKIYFGASAGVGKTYTMLESARTARAAGIDVVVGYVDSHGRIETERLLEGLEQLPHFEVSYRGITRSELDLDAALARRPAIMLVDELAHSNVIQGEPKPRHSKRWQDIEELLASGISVWSTLNVQHLESLNDVVESITGLRQRETVPDRIFDQAGDVELVDLSPRDLLARLQAGKVYEANHVSAATKRFFSEPNLLALRQLALRRTADRVDAAARQYGDGDTASKPWLARDRFLVAVALDDQAEQLIRVGKRFADALDAEWMVVTVETPGMLKLDESQRNRRIDILRLAESLGAVTVTLDGPSASTAIREYAQLRNITRIVVGEPRRFGIRSFIRPSTATKLVRETGGIDVSVIARRTPAPARELRQRLTIPTEVQWSHYWGALGICAACTVAAAVMYPFFELTNLVMVYLLGATITALRLGRGPASLAAVANILAFDFYFVPPRYSFAVADVEYLVTFSVMLTVALIIANLVANVRAQTRVAGARERRTALLYAMSRELAATRILEDLARVAVRHVAESFDAQSVILVSNAKGQLQYPQSPATAASLRGSDRSVAQWVYDHNVPAGLGTDTLPASTAQYLPLNGSYSTLGVLVILPRQRRRLLLPEQRHLVETFAGQIALAIERARAQEEAESARISAETEGVRNTLLASISHDLRTPLAVITAASSALNDESMVFAPEARRSLIGQIEGKANEMSGIISNVLELIRLESGSIALRRQWITIAELLNTALERLQVPLTGRAVTLKLPADLAPLNIDGALMMQVFMNLLENAAKHTPAGTAITVSALREGEFQRIDVEDEGPGLPPGDSARLFDKFYRGHEESNTGGAGLGLSICRAIVQAHAGQIAAITKPQGGARFSISLPIA
jgi:two-component system sensor histidine kinase KdpD